MELTDSSVFIQRRPGMSRRRYNRAWRQAVKSTCGVRVGPAPAPFRVYVIINKVTDEKYVGVTKRQLYYRWSGHMTRSRDKNRKKQQSALTAAIQKYGKEAFTIRALSETLTEAVGYQLEKFWIRELQTQVPNGYNMTEGGRAGFSLSQKIRRKISKAQKLRMADPAVRDRLRQSRTRPQRQIAQRKSMRQQKWQELVKKFLTPISATDMVLS